MIVVDDTATQRQTDALVAALTGSLGGPLQELADLLGELLAVEHAPITLRREGRLTTLSVGRRILVEGTTSEGPSGRLMTLSDGKLSNVLGSRGLEENDLAAFDMEKFGSVKLNFQ